MIARIHDDHDDGELKIGSTISLIGLSIRFGKPIEWVRRQVVVNHMGETWEAEFYNGGRRRGYKLISRVPVSMCIERTVQQDHAATRAIMTSFMPIGLTHTPTTSRSDT